MHLEIPHNDEHVLDTEGDASKCLLKRMESFYSEYESEQISSGLYRNTDLFEMGIPG